MATYRATERAFIGGRLIQIGDSLESATDPGFPFVPAHLYKVVEAQVVPVPTPGGFVVRGEDGKLVPAGKATRLVGRSPHELRPFARD